MVTGGEFMVTGGEFMVTGGEFMVTGGEFMDSYMLFAFTSFGEGLVHGDWG